MAAETRREYFIGLDMGTSSVGWAVTDPEYNIIKKAGKALWGVRLFDEASTAKDRRLHRAARRRTQRRAHRIDLLQELFAPEISIAENKKLFYPKKGVAFCFFVC